MKQVSPNKPGRITREPHFNTNRCNTRTIIIQIETLVFLFLNLFETKIKQNRLNFTSQRIQSVVN